MTTQDTASEYSAWNEPGTPFKIFYSLPLFHEIELSVSENYRRIPHGGIEIGGLLLGRYFPDSIRIEAFRHIECEHALGPSFKLSDGDIERLRQQIEQCKADPELEGLETLGWFISHTRGPLQLTPAEASQFDDLFPGPEQVTLLVKPEKFRPTHFAFLIRGADGRVPEDGAQRAIILPLPGRAGKATLTVTPDLPPGAPAERTQGSQPDAKVASSPEQDVSRPAVQLAPELHVPALQSAGALKPVVQPEPVLQDMAKPTVTETPVPTPFQWQFDQNHVEKPLFSGMYKNDSRQLTRAATGESGRSRKLVVLLIFLAAAMGGAVGYWGYLQLPAPVIPLSVQPQAAGLTISWPPEQTSNANEAAIKVNDGESVELPLAAKAEGRWVLQVNPDNVKVELIVRHFLQDSRGIVRYVEPALPPAPPPVAQKPIVRKRAASALKIPVPDAEPDLSTQ